MRLRLTKAPLILKMSPIMKAVQNFLKSLTVLAALFGLAACSSQDKLVVHTASGEVSFIVDIADNDETRAKGLMFVQSLADDRGMLFDFKETRIVSFWMRNTFIPLDMIFIAEDGEIKYIHANARPHDETGISPDMPVRFVLEIAGGRAAELGLEVGDKVSHRIISGS